MTFDIWRCNNCGLAYLHLPRTESRCSICRGVLSLVLPVITARANEYSEAGGEATGIEVLADFEFQGDEE